MSDKLKNCPHCGNSDHLMMKQVEGETVLPDNLHVVCSWLSGGCGASGGVRKTKESAIAAWNTRADDAQVITSAEKYKLADSREQLEADIHDYLCPSCDEDRMIDEWLDRQAAITEQSLRGKIRTIRKQNKKYRKQIAELTAERDQLQEQHGRQANTIERLTAERDMRRVECDRLRAECDRLRDKLSWSGDMNNKLRDKLAEKQHVCDIQRDSFLKLERENRELQDVCGELERTIENLRGME